METGMAEAIAGAENNPAASKKCLYLIEIFNNLLKCSGTHAISGVDCMFFISSSGQTE